MRTAVLIGIYIMLLGISVQLFMIARTLQQTPARPAAVAMQKGYDI